LLRALPLYSYILPSFFSFSADPLSNLGKASTGSWPAPAAAFAADDLDDNPDFVDDNNEAEEAEDTDDLESDDDDDDDDVEGGSDQEDLSELDSAGSPELLSCALPLEVLEMLFQLCVLFITEEFNDGQPQSSAVVYFSGVLGLSSDGGYFLPAQQYTPCLSALIYIQRLLFLEYALP
jgi:hypothetical protein